MKLKSLLMVSVLGVSVLCTPISVVNADSGGIPAICHYYSDVEMNDYVFGCYNDMKVDRGQLESFLVIKPTGSHVSKSVNRLHRLFQDAKNSVDTFVSYHGSVESNYSGFVTALAVGAVTWETVVGAVGSGLVAAYEASETVGAWNKAKEKLQKSYDYINVM